MKAINEINEKSKLDVKIQQITAEFNFKNEVKEKLPTIKTLAFLTGRDGFSPRIICSCKNKEEFKEVLKAYPSTNEKQIIGTASDKYYHELHTPYKITIDNPANPNQYNYFEVKIYYKSNKVDVTINLPIAFISDFVTIGERNITESEYHYFIGYSHNQLHSLKVRHYNFKGGKQINWYGGDKTLTDEKLINEIIESLLS